MIRTVTLNPAVDHILYLDAFTRNITNRVSHAAVGLGGKGTHVSVDLAQMGMPSAAYGFAFGENGRRIERMLLDAGVEQRLLHCAGGESRDNYLIVEEASGDATLIAEQGPSPSAEQREALYDLLDRETERGEYVALCGDASNFADPNAYCHIMERLSERAPRFALDASGETLRKALALRPFLVKPNRAELSALLGEELDTPRELTRAISRLERQYGIYAIVVSMGGEGAAACIGQELYHVRAPKIDVRNTVGCGDCMVAGLLYGFARGMAPEELLRHAAACAAAAAESPLSAGFSPERARALLERTEVRRA